MSIDLFDTASLLSEEELMVKENVSRFVRENVKPIIQEHFEQHRFPSDLIQPIAELGLLGSSIEGYECAGMNATSYGLICQELERGDSGIRSFVSVQSSLVMYPIYTYGSHEQKEKWLPRLAKAESIGCFGLTESHGGSDPSNMKTHAKKDGDDWIINGSKMWITNGSIADVALIWAMTDEGIRGFIVETSSKGFVANKIENKFSLRASITSELFLDNVRVSNDSVLPNVIGLKGPLSCLTQARYGISWGVIGAAEDCLEQLLEYTDSRILFDRALSENQSIQIRLADMQRKIVMASLLSIRLGQLKDKNQMNPTQVSLAKWNNVRMALDIARDCRDMLGGSGISAEYVPIRHMLNLESVITYEGTETIHQLTVGRNLTGKSAF
ncbi:MAG: acyl-CoA dehydrogenase family protein [Gammaproteobacteria bacterium]|jgi:glutaryl-CoA dehydrogenase|nr:acyl-CoA dehydrogenase family protein [Gammaproteobacteria bacterium]